MKNVLVFTSLLLALMVGAQKPCCMPKQVMMGMGGTIALANPTQDPLGMRYYLYGAHDFTNRKFGFFMSLAYANGSTMSFRIVQKYAEGSQWVIIDEYKYCEKQPSPKPEPTGCIPDNATYTGTSFVGGASGLWEESWFFETRQDPVVGTTTMSVVKDTCYPLSTSFIGTTYEGSTPVPTVSGSGFANMTIGIPDPSSWFTLPSYCNEEENKISSPRQRFAALRMPSFF